MTQGFEVLAALAGGVGDLPTRRPAWLVAATSLMTLLGVRCARRGGVPTNRRSWALFALSASGGAALTELADIHLLRLHGHPYVAASIGLHGLAVLLGLVAARLLLPDQPRVPTGVAGHSPSPSSSGSGSRRAGHPP